MSINIAATSKTPQVIICNETGTMSLTGTLIPENPITFFKEITQQAIELYEKNNKIKIEFDLTYFNTSAAKYLYDFLIFYKDKANVEIVWIYQYDDEDILESGKEFEEFSKLNFSYKVKA